MNDELLELRDQLAKTGSLKIDMRGEGKAAFLYIQSSKHAVEISVEGNGFFVEYWDEADEESEKGPVRSEIVESKSDVIRNVTEWL